MMITLNCTTGLSYEEHVTQVIITNCLLDLICQFIFFNDALTLKSGIINIVFPFTYVGCRGLNLFSKAMTFLNASNCTRHTILQ